MRALRLLIVHDDDDFLDVASRWFGHRGFMVMACETVTEAISAAERGQLDVAIVDRGLDDSKSSQLVRQLKALEPSLPIIVLSGWSETSHQQTDTLGVVDYVVTPTSLAELEAAVRRALAKEVRVDGPPPATTRLEASRSSVSRF